MQKLTIIGAGKVGKTLGRLFARDRVFVIADVLNRGLGSARDAAAFIGSGRPLTDWAQLSASDVFLIAVPDDAMGECAERLTSCGAVAPGATAFHVSGSKSSAAIGALRAASAQVASLHPVKSFAEPSSAVETFPGTYCALEGDAGACEVLQRAVAQCGGRCFTIEAQQKLIYHAGTVFASNYLVSLCEVAFRCFAEAGMSAEQAAAVALPLLRGTIDNVARLGTVDALTGPIARGDSSLVLEQLHALCKGEPAIGELYARLGSCAVELSERQGAAPPDALARIEAEFRRVLR